jgi:hypothetical protein
MPAALVAALFYTENTLWHSLFGLLFWDELFESDLLHSSFDWVHIALWTAASRVDSPLSSSPLYCFDRSRRPRGLALLLRCLRGRDLGTRPPLTFVRSRRLAQGGDLEARVLLDFRGHRLDPPVTVVVARVRIFRTVPGDESFDLAIHLHVPRHALEEMAPRMVGLHAYGNAEPVHPFAESLGHLFELGIARLSAAAAIRIVEQRLVELLTFLGLFQEVLRDHVRVGRDHAPLGGLLERRFDEHAMDVLQPVRDCRTDEGW